MCVCIALMITHGTFGSSHRYTPTGKVWARALTAAEIEKYFTARRFFGAWGGLTEVGRRVTSLAPHRPTRAAGHAKKNLACSLGVFRWTQATTWLFLIRAGVKFTQSSAPCLTGYSHVKPKARTFRRRPRSLLIGKASCEAVGLCSHERRR